MDMMNLDNFAHPFMPFHQKFDDSAEEGEIDDEDDDEEGFGFEDGEGGYEMDDDFDEGDMVDVKPPPGVDIGDEAGMFEGINTIIMSFLTNVLMWP